MIYMIEMKTMIFFSPLRHSERSEESLAKNKGIASQTRNDGVVLILLIL